MNNLEQSPKRNKIFLICAWIFAILFVVASVGVIFSFFPTRKLFNPDFYKGALDDVRIYDRLPESIAHQLASNFTQASEGANSTVYLLLLDQYEWESILIDLIDPNWMQTQTENTLDQIFEIILTSPDPVNTPIEVSVLEIKSRLAGPEGIQAFNQILNAQDDCSLDQVMGLLQLGLGLDASIDTLLCRPPDYIISELNPVVESFLDAAVTQVPDQVSFTLPASMLQDSVDGTIDPSEIPKPILTIRRTYTLISWSLLLPLVLIILVTIFAVRSLRDLLIWWGATFLAAGGISLIIALILFPTMDLILGRLILNAPINFVLLTFMLEIGLGELSRQLASSVVMSVVIPAGILAAIGFILLLGAYLLRSTSPSTEMPPENADWD